MTVDSTPHLPIRRLLLFVDAVIVSGALVAAVAERVFVAEYVPLQDLPTVRFHLPEYTILVILALPVWLALAWKLDLYSIFERSWTVPELLGRVAQHHALGFVAIAMLVYASQLVVNRSLALLFVANSFVAMFGLRLALLLRKRYQYRKGLGRTRLVLVGDPSGPMTAFALHASHQDYPPLLVGYLTTDETTTSPPGVSSELESLGSLRDLDHVLQEAAPDGVLFFPPCDRTQRIENALLTCESRGIPGLVWVDMGTPSLGTARLTTLLDTPFVSFELSPKRADLLAIKHTFDVIAAALLILALLPLLIATALAILLTGGRPVLFGQERAGLRGRPFRMLKFRTMVKNADDLKEALMHRNEMGGPVFKIGDDPRITRLGRVLRKMSIDELPQLLHVLSGQMSLVGPRPLPLTEQKQIRGWHRRRLALRPGLTGLWQVSGRNDVEFERWMELDLKYVDEWSLWLDAKILVKTVPVVLLQRGAR